MGDMIEETMFNANNNETDFKAEHPKHRLIHEQPIMAEIRVCDC